MHAPNAYEKAGKQEILPLTSAQGLPFIILPIPTYPWQLMPQHPWNMETPLTTTTPRNPLPKDPHPNLS